MRRSINLRTDGRYDVEKVFALVRLMWDQAMFEDVEKHVGLYIDVIDCPECRHFRIYETASSVLNDDREDVFENGVLEFRLFDDHVVVSSWPRRDSTVDAIVATLSIYLKWEPFHPTLERI